MSDFDGAAALDHVFDLIRAGSIGVYNEISLQLELGYFLRTNLPNDLAVEFERPAYAYGARRGLTKTEIDIVVVSRGEPVRRWAIELKFPQNGQYPEQMFSACKDLRFLEELCDEGFEAGWFAMLADAPGFYSAMLPAPGIYAHFRQGLAIHGRVRKPTGRKDQELQIRGSYEVDWVDCGETRKCAVIHVGG